MVPIGDPQGLLSVAAALLILKAFANGSASLTGIEAISDSVPLFKSPEHKNARKVLILMSATLATLIAGIALLAKETQAVPYADGTPTLISLEEAWFMRHLDGQHMLQTGSFRRASGYATCYDVCMSL